MEFSFRLVPDKDDRFAPDALDQNVGKTVLINGKDCIISKVSVIEEGKAAIITVQTDGEDWKFFAPNDIKVVK